MIPSPWVAVVLTLTAFRLTRLAGWDEFPLAAKVRAFVTGEYWVKEDDVEQPGKTPESASGMTRPAYRRPTLAHLIHCPFCVGFYISCVVYVAWLLFPTEALYAAAPFALSGAVGLIAKNLDE